MKRQNITCTGSMVWAFLLPMLVFAQAKPESLKIGGYTIDYDQKLEADTNGNGKNDRTSYYKGEQLVFTAYDENEDGKQDLWLRFKNGETVDLELADKNTDGKPDTITEIDAQGKAEIVFDSGAVGTGSATGGMYILLGMAVAGAGAYWYLKKVRGKDH